MQPSTFDIRRSCVGLWHQRRYNPLAPTQREKSDTEITVELEFDGNINADSTLIFTVGAGAIANYNGPALTAQITVTANREERASGKLPESVQPGDMDSISTCKTHRSHHHYLRCERTNRSDIDTRIPTRRYLSKPQPCRLLGWQKSIR